MLQSAFLNQVSSAEWTVNESLLLHHENVCTISQKYELMQQVMCV